MAGEKDLVDALSLDLDTSASLPAHTTVKYRRPSAILPEDCPIMVVWLEAKTPRPVTTHWHDSNVTIGVSWHEETVAQAATLIDDPAKALLLMEALRKIEARVRVLSRTGLSGTWQVLPGESRYLPPDLQQGLTEGYALAVEARVTEG